MFRAVVQKDERSLRALHLTSRVIELNAANYTAWAFRRSCIENLEETEKKNMLREDLEFTLEMALEHPKNYQILHHRQFVVTQLASDFVKELDLCDKLLEEDAKNYHVWTYRQWVITSSNLDELEADFVDNLLNDDVRNNSAWNYKFWLLERQISRGNLPETERSTLIGTVFASLSAYLSGCRGTRTTVTIALQNFDQSHLNTKMHHNYRECMVNTFVDDIRQKVRPEME